MTSRPRHMSAIWTLIALITSVIALADGTPAAADDGRRVGTSQHGASAIEYIGVIEQVGPAFTAVGFLTHVDGIHPADLFTDPTAPGALTARFTFSAVAGIASHAQVGSVTQIAAPGILRIFFNEAGGADFGNPASFSAGIEVATLDVRFHNILTVIAPNQGVAAGTADAVQTAARSFNLGGRKLRFGHPQLVERLTFFGGATRSQAEPPHSTTQFAGSGVTR